LDCAPYARVSTTDPELRDRTARAARILRGGWQNACEYVATGWGGAKASRQPFDNLTRGASQHRSASIRRLRRAAAALYVIGRRKYEDHAGRQVGFERSGCDCTHGANKQQRQRRDEAAAERRHARQTPKVAISIRMDCAIYARVSTTDQNCEMQLRELRDYCERRGWKIAKEYVDTCWSGAKA